VIKAIFIDLDGIVTYLYLLHYSGCHACGYGYPPSSHIFGDRDPEKLFHNFFDKKAIMFIVLPI